MIVSNRLLERLEKNSKTEREMIQWVELPAETTVGDFSSMLEEKLEKKEECRVRVWKFDNDISA